MIVSHESRSLFVNADTAKKILDRFVPPVKIELPENMAFRLMAKAMKKTSDSVLADEWQEFAGEQPEQLVSVRNIIESSAKRSQQWDKKTVISDEELQSIVPIHPYAALLLKNICQLRLVLTTKEACLIYHKQRYDGCKGDLNGLLANMVH